jgi:hypothetical protein
LLVGFFLRWNQSPFSLKVDHRAGHRFATTSLSNRLVSIIRLTGTIDIVFDIENNTFYFHPTISTTDVRVESSLKMRPNTPTEQSAMIPSPV